MVQLTDKQKEFVYTQASKAVNNQFDVFFFDLCSKHEATTQSVAMLESIKTLLRTAYASGATATAIQVALEYSIKQEKK